MGKQGNSFEKDLENSTRRERFRIQVVGPFVGSVLHFVLVYVSNSVYGSRKKKMKAKF